MDTAKILAPGIVVYPDAFSIDDIYDEIKLVDNWTEAGVASSRYLKPENFNKDILRDVNVVYWPLNSINGSILLEKTRPYLEDYISRYGIDTLSRQATMFHILKYLPGQHFKSHIDEVPEEPRKISTTFYFNDDYEGGGIFFTEFNLYYKPKKNDFLVFPSFWPYRHEATPVLSGTKYAFLQFIS